MKIGLRKHVDHFRWVRSGFTLIEFAMVSLILGVVIVVTIPVIVRSQHKARKTGCAMRMGRLAQSVLAYEMANGRLPVAGVVAAAPNQQLAERVGSFDQNSGQQLSWVVLTLPFSDLATIHDQFDFNRTAFEQSDLAIRRSIPALICPDDTVGARYYRSPQTERVFGLGNYAAFTSPTHGEHEEYFRGALGGFEPGTLVGQRLARITDGLSTTFMLSEVRRRPSEYPNNETRDPRGMWSVPWVGSSTLSADLHSAPTSGGFGLLEPYQADTNQPADSIGTPNKQVGISDQIKRCPLPVRAQLDFMPCSRYSGYGNGFASASPRSLHQAGVNVALVDGRVIFIRDDINHIVFGQLICVDDGQPTSFRHRRKLVPKTSGEMTARES